ncbi:MAG: chalcone isomerase family protein [Burkholderiales bacterium]
MKTRAHISYGRRYVAALVTVLGVLSAAQNREASAQTLPPTLAAEAQPLRESGAGRFRWYGLHVYDARLWVSGERYDAANPFALGLRYARTFTGAAIATSSIEEMRRLGATDATLLSRWESEMQRVFPNVAAGDDLVGLHRPRRGVAFYLNGRAIGEIADAGFAQAFFGIWLDPRTRGADLRNALLGDAR